MSALEGGDAASFAIDAKTGQLKTKAALDHDTKASYTVILTATDSANASDNIVVTITVTNVNEPPSFGLDAANRKVDENTPPGDSVGLPVSAEDDDVGDTRTYSLAGADSASFAGWRLGTNSGAGSQRGFVRFGRREIRRDAVVVHRDHNDGAGGDDSRRQHVRCEEAEQATLPRNSAEKPRVQ